MKACYLLVKNYGIALILFTVIIRVLLLPLNIKQQKSSARMAKLQPELQKLQKKYANNKEKYQEEMMNLYAKENASPTAGCLPMLITMLVLFALIEVVYNPLYYVTNVNRDDLEDSNTLISNLYSVSSAVNGEDTTLAKMIEKIKKDHSDYSDEEVYKELKSELADIKAVDKLDMSDKQWERVLDSIELHNDIDEFMLNEDYITKNLARSRPYRLQIAVHHAQTPSDHGPKPDEIRQLQGRGQKDVGYNPGRPIVQVPAHKAHPPEHILRLKGRQDSLFNGQPDPSPDLCADRIQRGSCQVPRQAQDHGGLGGKQVDHGRADVRQRLFSPGGRPGMGVHVVGRENPARFLQDAPDAIHNPVQVLVLSLQTVAQHGEDQLSAPQKVGILIGLAVSRAREGQKLGAQKHGIGRIRDARGFLQDLLPVLPGQSIPCFPIPACRIRRLIRMGDQAVQIMILQIFRQHIGSSTQIVCCWSSAFPV